MNILSQYLVEQLQSAQDLKNYKIQNRLIPIEFDDYFKYSGKEEQNNRLISITPRYRARKNALPISNDMSKYKLKQY